MSWMLVITVLWSGYVRGATVQMVGPFATQRACAELAKMVDQEIRVAVRWVSTRCVDLNAP